MGYTHYWRRIERLDPERFTDVVKDVKAIIPGLAEAGVILAGPRGTGKPVLSVKQIAFNGVEACGHARRNLGITWPAHHAAGVRTGGAVGGSWFAGASLSARTCDGDCSHESFIIDQVYRPDFRQENEAGLLFNFCKTAYKPYDLAVTAALIIACQHFSPKEFLVSSDGESKDWEDARRLCQYVLGYGAKFELGDE